MLEKRPLPTSTKPIEYNEMKQSAENENTIHERFLSCFLLFSFAKFLSTYISKLSKPLFLTHPFDAPPFLPHSLLPLPRIVGAQGQRRSEGENKRVGQQIALLRPALVAAHTGRRG
jgi:hypothetical protein